MKTYLHEAIMERLCHEPDSVVDDILHLASAAKRLQELYPRFRDDPSDEDLLAWMELGSASDIFLQNAEIAHSEQNG
jgi:hypothetical protein